MITLSVLAISCSKSYKCQCFTSGNEYPIGEVSLAEAEATCNNYEEDPFNGNCAVLEE
jgi:hypothetical protein